MLFPVNSYKEVVLKKFALALLLVMILAASANAATFYGTPSALYGDWSGTLSVTPTGGTADIDPLNVQFGPDPSAHDPENGYFYLPPSFDTTHYPSLFSQANGGLAKMYMGYTGTYDTLTTFINVNPGPDCPYFTFAADDPRIGNIVSYTETGTATNPAGTVMGSWAVDLWAVVDSSLNDLVFAGESRFYLAGFTEPYATYAIEGALSRAATPIPGAIWLLGSGIAGLAGIRRKMKA